MRRGTTPTHTFTTSVDLTAAEVLFMTYKQAGKIIVEKSIEDIGVETDKLIVKLTQEDTLAFADIGQVEIQCRRKFEDDTAIASDIIRVPVCRILKEGEI